MDDFASWKWVSSVETGKGADVGSGEMGFDTRIDTFVEPEYAIL